MITVTRHTSVTSALRGTLQPIESGINQIPKRNLLVINRLLPNRLRRSARLGVLSDLPYSDIDLGWTLRELCC